jgi:hypothetical protein
VRLAFDMRQEGCEIVGIDLSGDPAIGEWYEHCECLNACCAPQPHRFCMHLIGTFLDIGASIPYRLLCLVCCTCPHCFVHMR